MTNTIDMETAMTISERFPMKIIPQGSGESIGSIMTSPVFLDYTKGLFERLKEDGPYRATALFLPNADFTIMRALESSIYEKKGIKRVTTLDKLIWKRQGKWKGQTDFLLDQGKIGIDLNTGSLKKGYEEGAKAIRLTSSTPPSVGKLNVTENKLSSVDPPAYRSVPSGTLAICHIVPYYYPTSAELLADESVKRGVAWGVNLITVLHTGNEGA